jgi:hypothetical protein
MATGTNGTADIRLIRVVHDTYRTGLTRLIDATAKLEPAALRSAVGPYRTFYSALVRPLRS